MPRYGDDGVGAVQEIGNGGKVRCGNAHGTSGAEGLQYVVHDAHEAVEAYQNVFVQDAVFKREGDFENGRIDETAVGTRAYGNVIQRVVGNAARGNGDVDLARKQHLGYELRVCLLKTQAPRGKQFFGHRDEVRPQRHFKIVRHADRNGAAFKEPLTSCVAAERVVELGKRLRDDGINLFCVKRRRQSPARAFKKGIVIELP